MLLLFGARRARGHAAALEARGGAMLRALGLHEWTLELWLASDDEALELSAQHRGKPHTPDVLTFPAAARASLGAAAAPTLPQAWPPGGADDRELGTVVVAADLLRRQAPSEEAFRRQLDRLLAHGVAHALGFDHEEDEEWERMERVEGMLLLASGSGG